MQDLLVQEIKSRFLADLLVCNDHLSSSVLLPIPSKSALSGGTLVSGVGLSRPRASDPKAQREAISSLRFGSLSLDGPNHHRSSEPLSLPHFPPPPPHST